MNTPLVLLYHFNSPKGLQIKTLCMLLKIRVRTVDPGEYQRPLWALCESKRAEDDQDGAAELSEEMLVMANFPQGLVDSFLQGFRKRKIPPVALKAVLTPTNRQWSSEQLYCELREEHRRLHLEETDSKENE